MDIVHISEIKSAIDANEGNIIFLYHSVECKESLLQALENARCRWDSGHDPTDSRINSKTPGGIRVIDGKHLLTGDIETYHPGYLSKIPRLRVVL